MIPCQINLKAGGGGEILVGVCRKGRFKTLTLFKDKSNEN